MDKRKKRVLNTFISYISCKLFNGWLSKTQIILCTLFVTAVFEVYGSGYLSHVGIIPFQEEPLASDFADRLAAQGQPIFYIRDINRGISQGDIIRFSDRAVLIDADVWQTMQSLGILSRLREIPLLTLKARARSQVWDSRAGQLRDGDEKKAYTLGRELLKIFEDYFGSTPSQRELVVRFEGTHMTLIAPRQLLNELSFVNVIPLRESDGELEIITKAPPQRNFLGQSFSWTIWAVDPAEPSGMLSYSVSSNLPEGLHWDRQNHTISGVPQQSGSYPITISVENSRGQSKSIICTLSVIQNTAPHLDVTVNEPVISGTIFQYTPSISDAEHTLNELEVKVLNAPDELELNESTGEITWNVPFFNRDTTITFDFFVRDPLGAETRKEVQLGVITPQDLFRTVNLDLRLPLDTLIQGHVYKWPDLMMGWSENDHSVELLNITGDAQTHYRSNDTTGDGLLKIRPIDPGIHTIIFHFRIDTLEYEVIRELTVIENRPPVFLSSLTSNRYYLNQFAQYRPVVYDEDNDPLLIEVYDAFGESYSLENGSFTLPTDREGFHTFLLKATDPFGNTAKQQIYFHVEEANKRVRKADMRKLHRKSFDIGYQSGAYRLGLYSTDIGKTIGNGFLGFGTYESPFFYVGGSPLGEEKSAIGNYLFFDIGLTARIYNNKMFGGGVMARMEANYRKDGTSNWRFQSNFTTRLKQAIFFIDTTGFEEKLRIYINNWHQQSNEFAYYIEDLVDVIESYGKRDNFGVYLNLRTLYKIRRGFWIGPTSWIEDNITIYENDEGDNSQSSNVSGFGDLLTQYIGVSLLHEFDWRSLQLSQVLDVGWQGGKLTPKLNWNIKLRFTRN
ncbi:Ig domain-containing protein [Chitinispirillales bacterium ANBcel5]|uniref:Ig domain-containing protein n=1 Tax=Cellulosispirillum alkaliphilum TaxID=3039283 RepID=UPI002A55420D|nr:Ig domain-containing protein [Chitinispirillales bacterium ANBcel5]